MWNLGLILWKNLIIRKRHWFLTLIEICCPIILFSLVAYGRSKVDGLNKVYIDQPTIYNSSNVHEIYSHLTVGEIQILYAPQTDLSEAIIKGVQEKLQIPGDAVTEFQTKEELLTRFGKNETALAAAIIFNDDGSNRLSYDLTIYDKYFRWNTEKLFVPLFTSDEERQSSYIYKGYASLQVAIDLTYIELLKNNNPTSYSFTLEEFPAPPRTVDSGLNQLFIYFLPIITIFSFMFLCPAVLQRVGEEKSSGTKEYMKMVGLKSSVIWLGWFIHALCTNLFSIIAIVVLMKVPFWGVSYPPVEHSDGFVLFVFLFLYCMAAVTFCFAIASIFSSPSIATVLGIIVWLFSYFIPQSFINSYEYLQWSFKIPFALLPNMALYYGYSSLAVYEMRETGIQWSNIFEPGSGDSNDVTMGNVFVMLIVDTVLFMLLTLYIENVKPGQYGIAKPYTFPITCLKNFVARCIKHRVGNTNESLIGDKQRNVEEQVPCIEICDLYKRYYNRVAVDGLNMDIQKNFITVLLGQNGAGKTTTMSILTGMINATSGCVKINGKDIKNNTDEIRKRMGLCPQHNLLFPDLTVSEHLEFCAKLRDSETCKDGSVEDKKRKTVKDCAIEMLRIFGLEDKQNDMVQNLSGGQKRKLCLGMALIGNTEILILDEPTSGMDPESRRGVWDLLLEERKNRTVLITTHFMEEADVLADYIAIMANGKLQCSGTPLQLKQRYNTGYHLCLLLKSNAHIKKITSAVKETIPKTEVISETENSVVYLLPSDQKHQYKEVIMTLEENQEDWDILDINVKETTLNDVFLKAKDESDLAARCRDETDSTAESKSTVDVIVLEHKSSTTNPGIGSMLKALFIKRGFFFKEKYYWFVAPTVVAITVFLLATWLAVSSNGYSEGGGPSLNLTLAAYGKANVFYGGQPSTDPLVAKMRKFYSDAVVNERGQPFPTEDVIQDIITAGKDNIAFYKRHLIAAAELTSSTEKSVTVNALYSAEALHSVPISINLAMNAIVKSINENASISITNTPLTPLHSKLTPSELSVMHVTSVWLILLPISLFFFMANFVIFPNSEISSDFMQIQTIAGVKTWLYWISNILCDSIFSLVWIIILFSLFCSLNWWVYDSTAFQSSDMAAMLAIVATYIFVSLPLTYIFSYRKTMTGGFTSSLMFGIFTGIIPTLIVMAMEFSQNEHYMKIGNCLKYVLLVLSPQFGLSYICVKFSNQYVNNFNWKFMDPNKRGFICATDPNPCCYDGADTRSCLQYQSYFENKTLGIRSELLVLLAGFLFYFLVLCFLNTESFKRIVHHVTYLPYYLKCVDKKTKKDENKPPSKKEDAILSVENLKKSFGGKHIVKNLKLCLKRNKCFGLLGVNGAGKSTTFRLLTKYLFFDDGNITLKSGNDHIPISKYEYTQKIGYCPQEDCLNYSLTGRQTLYIMACVKGCKDPTKVTEDLLQNFGLQEYADKPCLEYSGGNKRKLCACLAFLGSPTAILLDEPTSGVDPASRRNFWKVLSSFKAQRGASVLLCSHSMEECENLCDDIAIMKEGKIEDEGSLLELKRKYQKGYKITVKLGKNDPETIQDIKEDIEKLGGKLTEEYKGSLTYQVDTEKRLSQIFETLENIKRKCRNEHKNDTVEDGHDAVDHEDDGIEDYSINQMSLEDVFLTIAEKKPTSEE